MSEAVVAVIVAVIWAFPVYWMINSSFLTPLTISGLTPTFVPFGGTLQNYRDVTTDTPFFEALTMSIMVVSVALIVCLIFATLAALAISRFRFKGRKSFVLTIILVQIDKTVSTATNLKMNQKVDMNSANADTRAKAMEVYRKSIDAAAMLGRLSGRTHEVYSAVAVALGGDTVLDGLDTWAVLDDDDLRDSCGRRHR